MSDTRLKSFIGRVERVQQDIDAWNNDKKEIYAEAKATGYCVKTMKLLISERRKEPQAVAEQSELLDLYRAAMNGTDVALTHTPAPAPARSRTQPVTPHNRDTGEIIEAPATIAGRDAETVPVAVGGSPTTDAETAVETLDVERAREALAYDPDSGFVTWRISRGTAKAGERAGSVTVHGYRNIHLDGVTHQEHRLIWLLVTGEFPPETVDHRDGDPLNNRWENLRLATRRDQQGNKRVSKSNALGIKGIRQHKNKFRADIEIDGTNYYLGLFATAEEASAAYSRAEINAFGEFASALRPSPIPTAPVVPVQVHRTLGGEPFYPDPTNKRVFNVGHVDDIPTQFKRAPVQGNA